jgi:hypothetical protein
MRKHTFPLRDINGNIPVRLEYSIPVGLSVNSKKMNTFALKSSLDSTTLAVGWTNGMLSSETSSNSLLITTGMPLRGILWMGSTFNCWHLVLRIPCQGCCICPFAVPGLGFRYLVTPFAVRFGHPLTYPRQMAFSRVEICGLHNNWCANRMLFAFVCTVCVKKAIWMARWAWALAITGAANGSTFGMCWEDLPGVPNGRVHKSVGGSFQPVEITLPLYQTLHVCLSNVTLQPALVNTCMPRRNTMERSGMMLPVNIKRRPLMMILHMCVDMT